MSDEGLLASRAITGRTQGETDRQALVDGLTGFLDAQPDFAAPVRSLTLDATRRSAGASSGTVLFEAMDARARLHRLVFRFDLGGAFFSQYALPPQFEIMRALAARGLPVPEARWLDAEGRINGKPGLIMTRIEGVAPSTMPFIEGPYMTVGAETRHAMLLDAARTLARFHATQIAGVADRHFARRGGEGHFLDREIAWTLIELRRSVPPRQAVGRENFHRDVRGVLEATATWLIANAPRHRSPELAHGDANISNFMYDGEGKVVALLDWELTHAGVGEADLAYQIAGIAHFALLAPPVEGIPSAEEMREAYHTARGKLDDWDFAEMLGEWRLAVFAAMGMSRLPADLAHVEKAYWGATRARLARLVPGI